jgi:hypothetical protein
LKVKQYQEKFKIGDTGVALDRTGIITELAKDFDIMLSSAGNITWQKFNSLASDLNIKFHSIMHDSGLTYDQVEGTWAFIFATEIRPRRDARFERT